MRKKILIGAPTSHRGWVIRHWLNHLFAATEALEGRFDIGIVLAADEKDESVPAVQEFCSAMGMPFNLVPIEESRREDKRDWDQVRFQRMVYLRNLLLERVRELGPDYFLSLDTDILLHHKAMQLLVQAQEMHQADAVGGKTYMTPSGRGAPSYGRFKRRGAQGGLWRPDADGLFKVDVIMAIKLMAPSAYNIDYRLHSHGEDIGWSAECRKAGLSLFWDGRVASKHVMIPSQLVELDTRVGF